MESYNTGIPIFYDFGLVLENDGVGNISITSSTLQSKY